MNWWRIVRSRPRLTQTELAFLSWTTAVFVLIVLASVVAWSRLETSPSGFHMQGKLVNQNGEPLVGVIVGYNYAWKGYRLSTNWPELAQNPNLRMFPRLFESAITNQDGLFFIDITKESIGYVTILGFWENQKSYAKAVSLNQRKIEDNRLFNQGRLMPWEGGVVKHYEPGWRVVDAIFGWGSDKTEEFVIDTSSRHR